MNIPKHNDDHAAVKHRDQVFARYCAELVREAGNRNSFSQVKSRILTNREILNDPALLSMLRAFIAEREAAFRASNGSANNKRAVPSRTAHVSHEAQPSPEVARKEASRRLEQLDHQFRELAVHFYEAEAERVYEKIIALLGEHADLAPKERLTQYKMILSRMESRRKEFDHRINDVAGKAVAAVKAGDLDSVARALKRISSIHALYPQLLNEERFAQFSERFVHAGDEREHRAAAHNLIKRERAVASELQSLASKIHHFHKLAQALPHDSTEYRKAEADYHQAVQDVKSHDKEWLAGIIIEFVDLLAELHDPPPKKAVKQVDHFVASVRSALEKLEHRVNGSNL